jgi:hypothetical protein
VIGTVIGTLTLVPLESTQVWSWPLLVQQTTWLLQVWPKTLLRTQPRLTIPVETQQTSEVLTGQEEPDDPPPLLGAGAALTLRMAVAMMMRVWVVNCILMFGVGKELDLVESAVD